MLIGKEYKIESEGLNIVLSKKTISKRGKNIGQEYWSNEAYFARPAEALKYLADHKLRESGFKDLETITKAQAEIYKMIGRATQDV